MDTDRTSAFVFPGQGSQSVGMADSLIASSETARSILHSANDILGFSLTNLMANGPAAELEETVNAQPAILATSVAALRSLQERSDLRPSMVAGHSLGEFSALVAADSLDYPTALQLVRERGRLMKQAGDAFPGGMAAILGLDDSQITKVCEEASALGVIVAANRNCPGQIVISGEVAALEKAMELAKEAGARRTARLGVSIASHSPLMEEANASFFTLVKAAGIRDPEVPVIGNVTASPLTDSAGILEELRLQMENPVDWTGIINCIVNQGITNFIEVGSGAVLAGLIKRIDRSASTTSFANVETG